MATERSGKAIRRAVLIVIVAAVIAIVLPPFINVSHYKGSVIASISNAIGRPVTVDAIQLRLFPQPGFYLVNVAIGDDPAYSAEPILYSDEVTAYLSFSSLWRGKLEIARLNLKYPSLNLVEREDGSWNLESLLWKASRTQAAPTSARLSKSRPRFPYIEASNGRINFKYGLEKSVFSFINADFTLWSPAENQWRTRLVARPVRTDMPVTDTGTLKAEATIERANLLRDAPLTGNVTWERVQLGNLTRLLYGVDRGWRGALEASAQFSGTPGALHFTTAAKLQDMRRYDISNGAAANLNATCSGVLNISAYQLQDTECQLPLDGGMLSVQGTLQGLRHPRYALAISAENLSTNAVVNLARRALRNLPADLTASGIISASFQARRVSDAPSALIGDLIVNDLALHSAVLGKDIEVGKVVAAIDTTKPPKPSLHRSSSAAALLPIRALVVQSFNLALGAGTPVSVDGFVDNASFSLHLKGDATLERLQQFARAIGVGAPKIALAGAAAIDLVIGNRWVAGSPAQVNGTAQVKNFRAEVPGISSPVELASARVEFDHNRLALTTGSATVGKISLAGSAYFPRFCDAESPCEARFNLSADDFDPEHWNEVLNPRLRKRPWFGLFGGAQNGNVIANLHASGHFTSRRLTFGPASGPGLNTDFSIANGVLDLKNTRAELFGGSVTGEWKIDFSGSEPSYESTGTVARVQAEKLGAFLKTSFGSGTLEAKYKLEMSGWDAAALESSATAETEFTWRGGAFRIAPDGKVPWRVLSGNGKASLDDAGWTISASKWNTPSGIYQLSGTASRDSVLALEFTQENGAVWKVTGTMLKPQLSKPEPQPTQARR